MDKKLVVQEYLNNYAVLIVDKNSSSRSRLLKVMVDLGTKRNMIHTAGTTAEAAEIMKSNKIGLVLSDYFVGGGSGFDLFKMVRTEFSDNKNLCLILVTSNISQTAVAKAAEEDVDSFIIKPYTLQSIQENLLSTISSKIKPSPYIVKIEQGKTLLAANSLAEALKTFEEAVPLHPRPSLAMFYMGQVQYMMTAKEEAKSKYNKGLSFNSIHYKCLLGLFDVFMKDNKHEEAYQVVKKIAKYFPANPERLAQIIRLAIITKNYEDMDSYYEIFTQLDERTPQMVNYIGAGMFVAGKWYIGEGRKALAFQSFDKIAVSCAEFTKFLRAIVTTLIDQSETEEASKYLGRFQAGSLEAEDYVVSDYLLKSASTGVDNAYVISRGMELYNRNIRDRLCLKFMIQAMEKQGLSDKTAPYRKEIEALEQSEAKAA